MDNLTTKEKLDYLSLIIVILAKKLSSSTLLMIEQHTRSFFPDKSEHLVVLLYCLIDWFFNTPL